MTSKKLLPFMRDANANLAEHMLNRALDGLFVYLSRREAAIRQNPTQRSTDLLKKMFGSS